MNDQAEYEKQAFDARMAAVAAVAEVYRGQALTPRAITRYADDVAKFILTGQVQS